MDYEDIVRVNMDIPENKMCHIGDILICARNGSKRLVGKAAIVDREGMSFGAFMAVYRSICNPYVLHVINSAYFRNSLLEDTGTTTINQITQDMLKNALIPLPPLAEQKRIVKKLEEILPLCEILKRD
jgi:type I restriction enzyme S subunit